MLFRSVGREALLKILLARRVVGGLLAPQPHQSINILLLIGRAKGELAVNLSGNPHLAQGGSGDLLAGYVAGLLAQPQLKLDVATALRFAVWQHGAAADQLLATKPNFTIEDLACVIGSAQPAAS